MGRRDTIRALFAHYRQTCTRVAGESFMDVLSEFTDEEVDGAVQRAIAEWEPRPYVPMPRPMDLIRYIPQGARRLQEARAAGQTAIPAGARQRRAEIAALRASLEHGEHNDRFRFLAVISYSRHQAPSGYLPLSELPEADKRHWLEQFERDEATDLARWGV